MHSRRHSRICLYQVIFLNVMTVKRPDLHICRIPRYRKYFIISHYYSDFFLKVSAWCQLRLILQHSEYWTRAPLGPHIVMCTFIQYMEYTGTLNINDQMLRLLSVHVYVIYGMSVHITVCVPSGVFCALVHSLLCSRDAHSPDYYFIIDHDYNL